MSKLAAQRFGSGLMGLAVLSVLVDLTLARFYIKLTLMIKKWGII